MTDILFVHSQTLYAKATIPVALRCVDAGMTVTYQTSRTDLLGRRRAFSRDDIADNPTAVGKVDRGSLGFVAELIGLGEAWRDRVDRIKFSASQGRLFHGYDTMVGTTKNIAQLREASARGRRAIALGYQHLPVIAEVGGRATQYSDRASRSVFFQDNPFSRQHKFAEIVEGCRLDLNGFTHLDQITRGSSEREGRSMLVFHPGGYRNVLTEPGADKSTSYASQWEWIERICLPALECGLEPVIKVHPLSARFHGDEDLEEICSAVEAAHGLTNGAIRVLSAMASFWQDARSSALILTFGSSSIYDLWSGGLEKVFICNFEGSARSAKFDFFSSIFIESIGDYRKLLRRPHAWRNQGNSFAKGVMNEYAGLTKGTSVPSVIDWITQCRG